VNHGVSRSMSANAGQARHQVNALSRMIRSEFPS
jgi:hypothetical protein